MFIIIIIIIINNYGSVYRTGWKLIRYQNVPHPLTINKLYVSLDNTDQPTSTVACYYSYYTTHVLVYRPYEHIYIHTVYTNI